MTVRYKFAATSPRNASKTLEIGQLKEFVQQWKDDGGRAFTVSTNLRRRAEDEILSKARMLAFQHHRPILAAIEHVMQEEPELALISRADVVVHGVADVE